MRFPIWMVALLLNHSFLIAQTFEVENIHFSGDDDKLINIVILSDGYQQNELDKFVTDANSFTDALFAESPFKEYQDYFNVYIIKVPSNESGANHPGTATDVTEPAHPIASVDNYFGSSFDASGIHRLLVVENFTAVNTVLAINFPTYDQAFILTNSPYYGGSGGQFPVASTEASSVEIAIHELGHSFANLADEYYAGDQFAFELINMTRETDPSGVKWKNWYDDSGIGIYQHCCGGDSAQWYRPHEGCKMRFLGRPFCAVCSEGIIEKIHSLILPIDSYTPENRVVNNPDFPIEFETILIEPQTNSLLTRWILNDVDFDENVNLVSITKNDLRDGTNELTVFIQDTTQLLRIDDHRTLHEYSVSWTIEGVILNPDGDDDNDGILNADDECPNTAIGQIVDSKGCETFPFNAFKIYTETPTCLDLENGLIEITATTDTADYTFDVQVSGNGTTEEYPNLLSSVSPLSLTDLAPGSYSIKISLDDGYTKNFDKVIIGEAHDISARLEKIDDETKTAKYSVSGSTSYSVDIDQRQYTYKAGTVDETTISIPLKKGSNTLTIKGLECQSSFNDQIVLNGIGIHPNPVDEGFYINGGYIGEIAIFSISGDLVKEIQVENVNGFVDIEELSSGVYYVHFLRDGKEILKIVKQ